MRALAMAEIEAVTGGQDSGGGSGGSGGSGSGGSGGDSGSGGSGWSDSGGGTGGDTGGGYDVGWSWGDTTISGPAGPFESGTGGSGSGPDYYPPITVTGPIIKFPNGVEVGVGVTEDGQGAGGVVKIPF